MSNKKHKIDLEDKNKITYFGVTDYRGKEEKFGIKADDRTRHMYVIGKTGMGKSTLLENMAIQDIQSGEGLCFVDPHGTAAEKLLKYVPEHRINDVIYFAPFDTKYPMSLNILEHVEEDKRHLVSSGLMDTFKKVFGEDVFSGRMVYLLNNAVLSLLENKGESLLGINRIFADKEYRKKIVANVKDPAVLAFWNEEFAKYEDKYVKEASAAIQNKIGQFIMTPMIRNIVGQAHSSFDVRKIMDERKILICNFSIGQTGSENVNLIGSMLITKIYLAAMSRANLKYEDLQKAAPFYFYVDEFQNFVNDSFAQILSQARKYNLGLIIAHQYVEQLTDNVKAAVFGNVGSMLSFRVGATDAEALEKEFAPKFTADDIVNLGARQIYLRLSIDGVGSQPFSAGTMAPILDDNIDYVPAIIASSRAQFAKEKDVVEEEVKNWYLPINKIIPRNPLENKDFTDNNENKNFAEKRKEEKVEKYIDEKRLELEKKLQDPNREKAVYTLKLKSDIDKNKVEIKDDSKKMEYKKDFENKKIESKKESHNPLRAALQSAIKVNIEKDVTEIKNKNIERIHNFEKSNFEKIKDKKEIVLDAEEKKSIEQAELPESRKPLKRIELNKETLEKILDLEN